MKKIITKLSVLALGLTLGVGVISLTYKNSINEVSAEGSYNQSVSQYYQGINWDQTGATLKNNLYKLINITTAGWSYDGLYDAYRIMDVTDDGQYFIDIYSDSTFFTLYDSRINNNYDEEGDSMNREHIIPQGSFNKAAPMKSDIHHVLPSDGYVNNRRGSYPHGEVTGSPTYTSRDGCKLGSGSGNQGTVFEPMDKYKGDIARIYFYFVTCYENKMSSNTFAAFDKTTYPSISSKYLPTYLKWAKQDPVDAKEIKRNNEAYKGQGNRNPFVDCPYAVGAIWDSDHASDYGNKGEYTSGDGISVSKSNLKLTIGDVASLSATSTDASSISWSVSPNNIVTLSSSSSSSGSSINITANNVGDATLIASATIGGKVYQAQCNVHVSAEKSLSYISIISPKTNFVKNDTFTFGGQVGAHFDDDSEEDVTSEATFSGYDMSLLGEQTVTVSYTYKGVTKTTTYQINVFSYRHVYEEAESLLGTITYTSGSKVITGSGINVQGGGGYSVQDGNAWRLGSGSKTGTLTVTGSNINKVVVNAKYYSNDAGTNVSIGGENFALTNSYADYTKMFDEVVNSFTIASIANGKRVLVATITLYSYSVTDIGQSEDCVGLEGYIAEYMHMDYTESLGYCRDDEHHYYLTAKDAFNELNDHQRSLFTSNEAYNAEWERLSTWATFNEDVLSINNTLVSHSLNQNIESGNTLLIMVIVLSSLTLTSIMVVTSIIIIKKRRVR